MFKLVAYLFRSFFTLTFIALLFWGGYKAVRVEEPASLVTEVGKQADLVSKALKIRITDKNSEGEVLILTASEATVAKNIMMLKGIEAVFVSDKRDTMKIKSNNGSLEQNTNNAFFKGNVVVESENRYTLKTESLRWFSARRIFTSKDDIAYSSKNSLILGKGVEIDIDSQNVKIESSVDALFN